MAELKTRKNDGSVAAFINAIEDEQKRTDALKIMEIMEKLTDSEGAMWGGSIIGFGSYTYKYKSGKTNEWFLTGFSPRKQNLTIYLMSGFDGNEALMRDLGKYKTGKSCLYIKRLEDIDQAVLEKLITGSIDFLKARNAASDC